MAAGKQATVSIIADVGDLYKRLLNHKPVIQNEVHFFVKEFEVKREDNGLRNLQDAMRFANEMDTILLEEIMSSSHKFKQINAIIEAVNGTGGRVFDDENSKLGVPKSEQEALDRQVEECRRSYHEKQEQYDNEQSKHVELLKEEIQTEREAREKLRSPSQATSVGSSITIFPPEAQLSEESGSPPEGQLSDSPPEAQLSEKSGSPPEGQLSDSPPSEDSGSPPEGQLSDSPPEAQLSEKSGSPPEGQLSDSPPEAQLSEKSGSPPEGQLSDSPPSEESGSPPEDEGTTSSGGVEIEAEHNENNPPDNLVNHENT